MPAEKKRTAVQQLSKKISECTIAIATDYRGLPVSAMTDLRRALRERGIEYRVVKNTLAYLAAQEAGKPDVRDIVQGPTGLAFGYGEPTEPAKVLTEYIRSRRSSLVIKGAALDGRVLSPDQVNSLAQLPPREELVARLLGQMQAPIANLVYVLSAPARGLAIVLQRHIEEIQKEAPG